MTPEEVGRWVAVAAKTAEASDPIRLREAVANLIKDDHWRTYILPEDRQRYEWQDFRVFCKDALGISVDGLVDLLARYRSLAARVQRLGAPTQGAHHRSNTTKRGRGAIYFMERLLRERPDLAALVDAGEMKVGAAAVEAGFRRPTATVFVDSPEAAVKGLLRRFSRDELLEALK